MRSFFRVVFLFLYKMPRSPLFDHAKWIYFYNTNLYHGAAIELNDVNRNHTLLCVYNTRGERGVSFFFFVWQPLRKSNKNNFDSKNLFTSITALMCRMQRGNFSLGLLDIRKRDLIKFWYMDAPRTRAHEIVNVYVRAFSCR
jgi:hypothetical protein